MNHTKWLRELCEKRIQNQPRGHLLVVPRAKGGTNALSNLKLACRKCNRRKGDTMQTTDTPTQEL